MDQGAVVLKVVCREPEGPVIRNVVHASLTTERLKSYYDRLKGFESIFNHYMGNSMDEFIHTFVSQNRLTGEVQANGLVWEVDDVGLLGLSNVEPKHDALFHFSFWDRRAKGREPLLREFFKYLFRVFELVRISAEVPLYTSSWLLRFHERVGFIPEGRKRRAVFYKGQWFDSRLYSILREEIMEDASTESRAEDASHATV